MPLPPWLLLSPDHPQQRPSLRLSLGTFSLMFTFLLPPALVPMAPLLLWPQGEGALRGVDIVFSLP